MPGRDDSPVRFVHPFDIPRNGEAAEFVRKCCLTLCLLANLLRFNFCRLRRGGARLLRSRGLLEVDELLTDPASTVGGFHHLDVLAVSIETLQSLRGLPPEFPIGLRKTSKFCHQ